MYYRIARLKFECTGCGRCCFGDADSYIQVTEAEAEGIRAQLGVSRAWFRRRYLMRLEDGLGQGIRIDPDGRCSLLGSDMRCRVYAQRPRQCRTYPFWPEVVSTRAAWQREARRCEGIGRGTAVPLADIERRLRLERESE